MNNTSTTVASQPALQLILLAATAQGIALWYLTGAHQDATWPSSHPGSYAALLTAAVFLVPTIYALAEWSGRWTMWTTVAGVVMVLTAVGLHSGSTALPAISNSYRREPLDFVHFLVTFMLMFHAVPFMQCPLESGRWQWPYRRLFEFAWRNALRLALAGLFAGVSWLLLWTAAKLFEMLGINFLMVVLFNEGRFFWIPLSLAFGTGVYFAENSERLMLAARSLVLSLLKWLAAAAALILVLFSAALLIKTPTLIVTKQHVISATWLLWLAMLNIYLYNAGFQDGSDSQPYPRRLGQLLRLAVPLLLMVSVLALYALLVRVDAYGLTVPRVWGLLVAVVTLAYAVGYLLAARRTTPWMGGMARVNTLIAAGLVLVLFLMLTPVLAPQRLTAASLETRLLASGTQLDVAKLRMLRSDTGRYGLRRLQRLASSGDATVSAALRTAATSALESEYGVIEVEREPATVMLDVYPAGAVIDAALRVAIANWQPVQNTESACTAKQPCQVLLVDLNNDALNEAALYAAGSWSLFRWQNNDWSASALYSRCADVRAGLCNNQDTAAQDTAAQLRAGNYAVIKPRTDDLRIGSMRLNVPEP